MIDGVSDQAIPGATVLVRDGKIISVNRAQVEVPSGHVIVDGTGKWLLPGLIDAHVHLTDLKGARALIVAGVTTVRTMHANHFTDVGIRELHRLGAKDLPDVLASGYQLRPDMNVFESFILDFPSLASLTRTRISGDESLKSLVRANLERGVNQIKILATERGGTPDTDPRRQTFSESEMRIIVEEARKAGLSVAAHAHGDEGALAAVRAGVRTIEHGSFISDTTLEAMKDAGIFLISPIALGDAILATPSMQKAPAEFRKRTLDLFAAAHDTALRAWKKGVVLATGTDTNDLLLPRFTVAHDVAEFVKIGISPVQAIKAATSRAAGCLGISSRTGAIKPGLEADLL